MKYQILAEASLALAKSGLSWKQAASKLGVSDKTAKKAAHHAKQPSQMIDKKT